MKVESRIVVEEIMNRLYRYFHNDMDSIQIKEVENILEEHIISCLTPTLADQLRETIDEWLNNPSIEIPAKVALVAIKSELNRLEG